MAAARDDWNLYAAHRARFTDALLACAGASPGRLCVLGAGRCNDVDLERLAVGYSEIHLVDLEPASLAEAVSRQTPAVRARLHRHAPVELSGMSSQLGAWRKRPPSFPEVEEAAARARQALVARLPGPFDVVASACVLTQMSFALLEGLGEGHPMLGPLRLSLMVTHLDTLIRLAVPGGTSLLTCDLVSSSHYPLDQLAPDANLQAVMDDVVKRGAFYFAANPILIRQLLRRDPALRGQADDPRLLEPWLWTGPHSRTYLVYALRATRR